MRDTISHDLVNSQLKFPFDSIWFCFFFFSIQSNVWIANDIGVAKIQGKIEFNDLVKPIKFSSDEVPDGAELQLTGWGKY